MSHILLSVKGIDKSYGHNTILKKAHLALAKGEVLGLAGENGAGKSTLLKIISGVASPDSGEMYWEGQAIRVLNPLDASTKGIGMVFQEQNLIPTIPVFENMFLGRPPKAFRHDTKTMIGKCKEIFEQLDIDIPPQANTGSLPLGSRQLLEIAKVFIQTQAVNGHRVILLDEPTEALSKLQIEKFFSIIRKNKANTSFILVSHRLNEMIDICDRLVVMKDGEVVSEMDVTPETTEEHIHESMVGRQRDVAFYQENDQGEPHPAPIVVLNKVSASDAFRDVSFEIATGEIIGLAGMLGSGRSELAQTLVGARRPDEGAIRYMEADITNTPLSELVRRGVCYVPPERKEEGVILPHSLKWNLSLVTQAVYGSGPVLNVKKEKQVAADLVDRLKIKAANLDVPIQHLSGGNQQKAVLGKWLIRSDIKLLVVEEPTRGIDVGAKQEIYKLFRELTKMNVSIVISTENLLELIGLCHRIVIMKDGAVAAIVDAPVDNKPHEVDIVKHMV